jgi:hypothetical protein
VSDAGWLLVGLVLGVLLAVALIEWHDAHVRRVARKHTRRTDTDA